MGWKYLVGLAGATFLTVGVSAPASAAAVLYCKDGPGIDLVNSGCISGEAKGYPGGGDGIYSNAGGGDPIAAVQAAIFGATGVAPVGLALYGKTDSNPGLFDLGTFVSGTTQSGTWNVLNDAVSIKYITVKAANSFALYELSGAGANSGTWTTAGILNNGGQQPGVSHISFWTAAAAVPEPSTWLMMLLGFGAVGFAIRRQGKQTLRVRYA